MRPPNSALNCTLPDRPTDRPIDQPTEHVGFVRPNQEGSRQPREVERARAGRVTGYLFLCLPPSLLTSLVKGNIEMSEFVPSFEILEPARARALARARYF